MRIQVARTDLARLLQQATKVVESRNTIPILGHVKLVAIDGRLTITATDLDIEISGSIECEGEISACVEAKLLAGIVAKLAGTDLSIERIDTQVIVKSGRSNFKLAALTVDDFPSLDAGKFDISFNADLAALFAPLQFAISTEETRYYLNGVFLEPTAATTTDGHRLATIDVDLPQFTPIIVPRKTVSILPKGEVGVDVSTTKIRITAGEIVITSKLIDGTFPDYRRVVPTENDKIVVVDKTAFSDAVSRVSTVTDERGKGVKLEIATGAVDLSVRGDAEATDGIEADYGGEPITVGFNGRYLQEALAILPTGPVNVALADNGSPTLFTSPAFKGLRLVLMPMRVG